MLKKLQSKIRARLRRSPLFRDFLYLLPSQILTLRKVHSLTLEVSSACNLRCVFCPVGNRKVEPHLMDLKTHHKIIDLLPRSIKTIRYSYRGDATLNKDFVKMIKF